MTKTEENKVEGTLLRVSFRPFAVTTVSLPLFSLVFCLVSSLIFQYDQVNLTECRAKNYIPSISAVTGVPPQRYLWRFCIGLHCTPRIAVAICYYNYYKSKIGIISEKYQSLYMRLIKGNCILNLIENSSLFAVACVSNLENYPLHEKIFVVFMFSSCIYMFVTHILFYWSKSDSAEWTDLEKTSWRWKNVAFASTLASTAGLLYFFYWHRIHCLPGAFSWFSFCEYIIAVTNMGFHMTAYWDFYHKSFLLSSVTTADKVSNNHRKED